MLPISRLSGTGKRMMDGGLQRDLELTSEIFAKSVPGSVGTCVLGGLPAGWRRCSFIDPCGFLEYDRKPGNPQPRVEGASNTQPRNSHLGAWECVRERQGSGLLPMHLLAEWGAMVVLELPTSPNLLELKFEKVGVATHNPKGNVRMKKRYSKTYLVLY